MAEGSQNRIDKYLWTVRIFKTRSLASEACKKGKVLVDNNPVKASRIVQPGDIIQVKKQPVNYLYSIIAIPNSRISAKLVPDFMKDMTPEEELKKLAMHDDFFIKRDRGTGRPTKKERRVIDQFKSDSE
jgi:ribosome-associated heat shock protein Hsp15